jgi:hypothetical protein
MDGGLMGMLDMDVEWRWGDGRPVIRQVQVWGRW